MANLNRPTMMSSPVPTNIAQAAAVTDSLGKVIAPIASKNSGAQVASVIDKATAILQKVPGASGTLTFSPGALTQTVTIATINDTLFDMVQMTTVGDAAPTTQTEAVSRETMKKVDDHVGRFAALIKAELGPLNSALARAKLGYITAV